jgi:hypothetical protein
MLVTLRCNYSTSNSFDERASEDEQKCNEQLCGEPIPRQKENNIFLNGTNNLDGSN